jgi:hypothetical protein
VISDLAADPRMPKYDADPSRRGEPLDPTSWIAESPLTVLGPGELGRVDQIEVAG